MVAGFHPAAHGDLDAVERLIDEQTGGILIEPILGEGGIVPASQEFLAGLRKIADDNDLLLVFDEVQSGRAKPSGLASVDVVPDVMTLAKSLCAGIAGARSQHLN